MDIFRLMDIIQCSYVNIFLADMTGKIPENMRHNLNEIVNSFLEQKDLPENKDI